MSNLVKLLTKEPVEIPLDDIDAESFVFRSSFEGLEELAESIKSLGLIEPVIVRRNPKGGKPYQLIAGHRRYRACSMIGLKSIKAIITDVNDKDAYLIAITENLQRKSLNPIEEAIAYYNYVHKRGWGGISVLAKNIGKSPAYVSFYIRLLELPSEVQEMIARGDLKPFVAAELEKVKDEEALKELVTELKRKKMGMRALRRRINDLRIKKADIRMKYQLVMKTMIASTRNCLIQYDLAINKLDEGSEEYRRAIGFRYQLHQLLDQLINEYSSIKKELSQEGVYV